ncbi:Zip1 protein [Lasiodiplodia theobromae]|uniref:Zip1 protein n=1 Tax=Lasiodiplodia theobromae TaxID=45133 RepID=UPI0015C30566|nr:Zip1 protein [Lasiodiplodia theobromae]KAF4543440.1 Zip1 protein [Lasiodiplodia theobromae]
MGADFVLFLFILVAMYSLWLSGIFELCAFLIARARAPAHAHTNPSDDKPLDKQADLKQADQANIIKNTDVKPTDPKLADRKAYVLKALNLKPSDIESSVVKTSNPKPSVVKTSDPIKSKKIARAETKVCDPIKLQRVDSTYVKQSIMAKPGVKPGYVKTIQMFDAIMADALLEYMKARVSKPIPVVTAAAPLDDTKSASKTADDAKAASSNIVDFINSVPSPVADARVAPDAVGDAKPASSSIADALNAIPDTVDDAKAAPDTVDPNTQAAATHKITISVSSVESWNSIGSTIVEVDTSTPVTSDACPRHWLSAIKLSPSDLSPAPIPPTYTESADGTIYRNGHAHGVSTAAHKSAVDSLQSSIHHLRKLNSSMTSDLSGALNVVAWEADTRVADLERLHQQALGRAEKRGNANATARLLEEHKDVAASLEEKHKAAMADLREEQKTTVWTLLKHHRSKMAFMEMAQKKEVALIRETHQKEVAAIEERHQGEVATLKETHKQDAVAVQREKDAQIASVTERVASLEAEAAANVGKMQAGDDVVAALEQTIAEKNTEIATVTGRLASLEKEVLASIDSVNTASERAVVLQKTVDDKQAEIDRILSEVVKEAESHEAEVKSLQKKHDSDLAFIFSKHDKLVAAMKSDHKSELQFLLSKVDALDATTKSDHESEIESLRSEFDVKVAAMEKKYDSHITNMEVDLTAYLEALDDECDATNASHQASINRLEVVVTDALISLDDSYTSTIVFHESTINILEVELTNALASLNDECNSTLASHDAGLRKIEAEILTSLQSLDDESTSTLASLTANNQAAENTVFYQELVSLEPVVPECDTPKPTNCKLVFQEVAALESASHKSSSNERAHQELSVQEPVTQEPIVEESDELESADQSIIDDDLHYPAAGNQDFVIYRDPSPSPANSSGTVVRHSSPFSYETSPLAAPEQYEARPSPVPAFIDHPTPFTGVWATHAALQNALSNATAVTSPPLGEQKVGSLLEAALISETAPITTAPKRNPSPTKQKLVTKEEWKALVASLNGSGDRDRDLAVRSAEAEARRAAELAEEAQELAEENDEEDVLAVYEQDNAEPSVSTPRPLPDPSSASPSAADLHTENAALRTEISLLREHITALTATNEHNSAAYLSAKATAEHNERAATEAASCLEAQTDLVNEVEAELVAASRDLEATEQRCAAAEQRADQAEKCAQHFDRLLRNVALDTLYLQRLEWSSRSQAGQVRRLLDQRVPLENAVARLHNENLRLRASAAETQAGSDAVFAYAEDVAGGMLALLQQAARYGVVNVATLAEKTNDEVVRGLAEYMGAFIEAANSNVREGRKLVVANRDLVAAAAADRDAIDALKEEVVQLKDALTDARTEVDDATVGEQLAQAELEKVKGVVPELKAAADRVPALERKVDDLQYALNEARVDSAPVEWQEVVEDMQMQLAAKQACLDTVTIRLTALNNVDAEHALCERREKSAEDQCEMNRRIISALVKRNHRLIEELTLTRERAGLPKGTYMIYNFTENEFNKVVLRAMLMRLADMHRYDLMEEDFAFCDELDRILDQPIEETEVQPLDREFTAAENIMDGVLSKITTVCKDLLDGEKDGEKIKHRGLGEKAVTDSEESWEPLDLSIDPEDEKENSERFEAEQERRKKATEELRAALLKADEDDQILEEESF